MPLVCKTSSCFLALIALGGIATAQREYNREVCLVTVRDGLQNGTIAANSSIFYRDDSGFIMSTIEKPVLTIIGCKQVCGSGFSWYEDIGPRLSTWLIPVFLLLTNMEVSPLDKRRYLMLAHLLGDPIDSLWSLLTKMEAWSRCHAVARAMSEHGQQHTRNIATVMGGFEELCGFYVDPSVVYEKIVGNPSPDLDLHVSRAAQKLADSRSDERLRTILATVLYIYQIVSSFIATVGGGNSTPPGGRIGMAMFMTWIIPSVLISNAIGCFTSPRTCFDILNNFVTAVNPEKDLWTELQVTVPGLQHHKDVESFFDSFSYSGAIYTYRPIKKLCFGNSKSENSPYLLLVLAMTPILVSSIVASVIIWHVPPIGLNCRNLLVFSFVILIFLSALLTSILAWIGVSGKRHWYLTITKDLCLAVPTVILVFLATAGRFNNCYCWSAVYTLGSKARIPLNSVPDFELFDKTIYPILVSVCLTLMMVAFAVMMKVCWRGWVVLRWSEKEKQEEWSRTRMPLGRE